MAHLFRHFTFELEEQTNEYKHLQKGNAFYGVVSTCGIRVGCAEWSVEACGVAPDSVCQVRLRLER